ANVVGSGKVGLAEAEVEDGDAFRLHLLGLGPRGQRGGRLHGGGHLRDRDHYRLPRFRGGFPRPATPAPRTESVLYLIVPRQGSALPDRAGRGGGGPCARGSLRAALPAGGGGLESFLRPPQPLPRGRRR